MSTGPKRNPYPPNHPFNLQGPGRSAAAGPFAVPGPFGPDGPFRTDGDSSLLEDLPEAPPVLISFAVVTLKQKVAQGHVVELRLPNWHAAVAALQRDPSGRFQIPPRDFEALVAGLYKAAGFDEVILTPSSGDFGIDVVATKWGDYGQKVLGQVKRYAADRLVKAEEIRSFVFALDRDRSASRGIVTTTSDFAPGVPDEFQEWVPTRIDLVNGTRLLDLLANPKRP